MSPPPDGRAALERQLADARDLAERQREHLAAVVAAALDGGADDEHDPDGGSTAFERAQAQALLERAHQRAGEVEAALRALDDGTRGRCAGCGGAIDPARLVARPAARTCIACARAATARR